MAMGKRIFLFIATNLLVMVTISVVLRLLGVQPYLTAYGIDYQSLMVFCLVWGMGGAFISLLMSKQMAKWAMGVRIIEPSAHAGSEGELVRMVTRLAQSAGLPKTPEVGIYDSPEVNAFATGPSKGNALVAVSTGLLQRMDRAEVEGVLGHEIAHVANGDMVTMTLIQGIVNAFVMFFARIASFAITQAMRSDDNERPSYFVQHMFVMVFEIAFGFLGAIVVAWFSRHREFRADRGGAQFAGREKMVAALRRLQSAHDMVDEGHPAMASLKINGKYKKGFVALFLTHPPLEERIARLQNAA